MIINEKLKKVLCISASSLMMLGIGGLFANHVNASTIHEHVAAKSLHGNNGVWLHNGNHFHIRGLLPGAYKVTIPNHRGEWIIPNLHDGAKQSRSYIRSLNFGHHRSLSKSKINKIMHKADKIYYGSKNSYKLSYYKEGHRKYRSKIHYSTYKKASRAGFAVRTVKTRSHVPNFRCIFSKYTPMDKRATIPKHFDIKGMSSKDFTIWVKGKPTTNLRKVTNNQTYLYNPFANRWENLYLKSAKVY